MTIDDLLTAMHLPAPAVTAQRVAKDLLSKQASTPADRRLIAAGIERLTWRATIKTATTGLLADSDDLRLEEQTPIVEIVVLTLTLKPGLTPARRTRLETLVHRSIAYPTLLASVDDATGLRLSLAAKRMSDVTAAATVLDGDVLAADVEAMPVEVLANFKMAIALPASARRIRDVWMQWRRCIVALQIAAVTGVFELSLEDEKRSESLATLEQLQAELKRLQREVRGERQIARQGELNLAIRNVRRQIEAVPRTLAGQPAIP